jgi:ABC-type nickel/cobalt efflux system permease component RcnA
LFATIIAGLAAGAVHVLAGPDHLAAVAPLAANGSGRPWRSGLFWGLGHAGGVLLVGFLAILLREVLPIERLSDWSERLVGVVLIWIGVWGVWRARRQGVHSHEHTHDGTRHAHLHVHERERLARTESAEGLNEPGSDATGHAAGTDHPHGGAHVHARTSGVALSIGVLHGLAGSAHFLGVLPALALPTRVAAATYVGCFGLGTVAAMTGFAALIGRMAVRSAERGTRVYRTVLGSLGMLAIVVGIAWLIP